MDIEGTEERQMEEEEVQSLKGNQHQHCVTRSPKDPESAKKSSDFTNIDLAKLSPLKQVHYILSSNDSEEVFG